MSIRSFKRAHARRVARERRRLANAKRRGTLIAGAALSASALMASSAQAATYTVTTTGDSGGSCTGTTCTTLRAAIAQAQSDPAADTISLSGLSGTIDVSVGGALAIDGSGALTINGPGAGMLAVSGANTTQIFNITSSGDVSISGLTLEDGNAGSSAPGGAIEDKPSSGSPLLTLANDTITGSTTGDSNGGGGIYGDTELKISSSTISGNTAPNGPGGGIESCDCGDLEITDSTISGNSAENGGGVDSPGYISVAHSQITGNHAVTGGGGVYAAASGKYGVGSLVLSDSTVSGNTSAGIAGGVLAVTKYGTQITSSTIADNSAQLGGGVFVAGVAASPRNAAKYNPIQIRTSTISGNQAVAGAGIAIPADLPGSPVTIAASTLSGNKGRGNSAGGGLLIDHVYGPLQVVDSTISGNAATRGGGVSLGYNGSGPLLGKGQNTQGSISFENSTIASNFASSAGHGGGIYLGYYATGSPPVKKSGMATLASTIVSGNKAAGALNDLARAAASTSGGFDAAFSLIQNAGNAPLLSKKAVIENVAAQLGPLANNGGPTQTRLPSGKSPVIDQGHVFAKLTADQRGDPRTVDVPGILQPPGGDGTDIGAVELPARSVIVPTAGLTASTHGVMIGGKPPLLIGTTTPVTCSVKIGTLDSCVIQVNGSKGRPLATGAATSGRSPTSLSAKVLLTDNGRQVLARNPLGVNVPVKVTASTSRSGTQTVSGRVILLASPSITLQLGTRSPQLSDKVLGWLDKVARLLGGAKSITCTAYTDKGTDDLSLTKAQAKAACDRLVKAGFKGDVKSVGKGSADPVAPNDTPANRAKNRRLVITFTL